MRLAGRTAAVGRGLRRYGFAALLAAAVPPAAAADLRIGITAYRDVETTRAAWQPMADYLAQRVPGHRFRIVPLDPSAMATAGSEGSVDFVVANGAQYIEMEVKHGAIRTATLLDATGGAITDQLGAVIFTRAERTDISTLADLRGKSLVAADPRLLAWLITRHEMKKAGVEPEDLKRVRFSGLPLDRVVDAVLAGEAEVGAVRAGFLEKLVAEGRIRHDELRVIGPRRQPGYPYMLSTPLYPERAFARLAHVDSELARQVTAQLLLLPADSPAARSAGIAGWTTPLNYLPMHRLLQDLQVAPYENYGAVDLAEAARQHWVTLAAFGALLLALGIATVVAWRLASRLRGQAAELEDRVLARTGELAASEERLRLALAAADLGLYDLNVQTGEAVVNAQYARMLDYDPASFHETNAAWIGRLHPDDRELVAAVYGDYVAGTRDEYRVEFRQRTASGDWRWIRSLGQLVARDEGGQPLRMIGIHLDITGRKEAEAETARLLAEAEAGRRALLGVLEDDQVARAALQQANERLERAEGYARLGNWTLAAGSEHGQWSAQMFRLFGLEPAAEPPPVAEYLRLIHPDDRSLVLDAMSAMAAGGDPAVRVFRTNPEHGPVRYLNPTSRCLRDALGRPLRYEGTVQDITEQREAEAALRASEARYRELFEVNPHPMWVFDLESLAFLAVNDAAVVHYGYRRDEFLAMTIKDIRPAAEVPRLLATVATIGRVFDESEVWRHRRKDGSLIDVEVTTHALAFDGRPAMVVLAHDVTERLRAEAEVRRLNRQRQLLAEAVQRLAAARDLDAVMAGVCTTARALVGADGASFVLRDGDVSSYADEDAIGPLFKGQRFPLHACVGGWVMVNRQPAVIEDIFADSRIPAQAYADTFVRSLAMVPIRSNDPVGAIGLYWAKPHLPSAAEQELVVALADATAVAMENVRLLSELEQRVRARTVELEAANKELESFSYSVSHDLRAPLRAISGFGQILARRHRQGLDAEGSHYLDNIVVASDRMATLIDDLLQYSRTGRRAMLAVAVDLAPIIDQVQTIFAERIAAAGARFEVVEPLASPLGDPMLIGQILGNLVENALTYRCRDGAPLVTVAATSEGPYTMLRVSDNGIGIAREYHEKIFQVFQRLHSDDEYAGTGIGLAIVSKAARLMGGEVSVVSEAGAGSTFTVRLPAATRKPGTLRS